MTTATAKWKPAKLDELGFVGRGKSRHRPRNAAILYGGSYPFFQTGDIKAANFYLTEFTQTYSEEGLAQSKLWKPGTLCITIAANIAESAILGIEGCFPDSVVGFVADPDKADVRFIKYYMEILKLQMQSVSRGTTQDNLSVDKLLSFDFCVPPLPIQRHIAGILSAYDELIENNQRRIRILEDMARSIYREWFIHFRFPTENEPSPDATHNPLPLGEVGERVRSMGEGRGEGRVKLVDSPLGQIPQGWEVKPLEAVCSLITDGAHHSPASVPDGFPMASVKDMHNWGINLGTCRKISEEDYELLVRNNCKPQKNDVLIAKDGSYLKHIFVMNKDEDLVILSSIALLRPNSSILPHYLNFFLGDPATKARMKGFVSGVAIPRIILKDFRKFLVVVPPSDIQAAWTHHADSIVATCQSLISKNQNLRRTRDLLLPRLMSGQVNLKES